MVKGMYRSLYTLLALFLGLFVASSFFVRAKYLYAVYGDTPVLEKQQPLLFLIVAAVVLLLGLGLYRLSLWLDKYPKRIVIPVVLLASFALQTAIVFLFPRLPTDDSQTVLSLAQNMLYRGDYSSFATSGYLHMFPFNFSIVLYLKTLLSLFPDNYLVIKLFNIGFTLVTTMMVYLLYKELNPRSQTHDYGVLVLAATYAPALFMNNFIYNDVIATALLTSALYFAVRFMKELSLKHMLGAAAFLAAGNYFRSIGAIFLLAIAIGILLQIRRIGIKKSALALGMTVVLFMVPGWAQNLLLQATGKVEGSVTANSAPVYMWLNMGINVKTFGFWDNRQSYTIYQRQAGYDKKKSEALFKNEIGRKWSEADAGDLIKMYYKKLVWMWTEGTYQVERYGVGNGSSIFGRGFGAVGDRYSYTTSATEWFKGSSSARVGLIWMLYAMNMAMYGFILVRLIGGIRAGRFAETPLVLVMLGFIGFYLVWEIKSRYLFPVYPLVLAMSWMGFKDAYTAIFPNKEGRNECQTTEPVQFG
ncbi:MAG: glycosyltransferase family 39 protein [Paenibacillaceae bacterium]|nr:glycosyltransferase family 39 protein [Paenibacillaceae bacterium]